MNLKQIGNRMGGYNYSTVIHARARVQKELSVGYPDIVEPLMDIMEDLNLKLK